MASFRSGTLERSVKRWGRFPRRRAPLKRVGHSWKYVELENTTVTVNGSASNEVIIHDAEDWVPATSHAVGCKNVSFDLVCTFTWTPATDAANTFGNVALLMGIFINDVDDADGGLIADKFAENRALCWDQFAWRAQGLDLTPGDGGIYVPPLLRWSRRFKGRARFLKFDEELRFAGGLESSASSVITDMRINIFGRVSWETP